MKPKNKIYPLLRMLAVALTAALLGPGCQKDFKWNEPLAVTQNGLNLTSPAGSTRVTVYSTGRWKAEMAEGAWGEVSEVSGNGIGDFLFTYEANNGVSRRARILVSGEGEEQEIVLTQAGAVTEPTLALAETEFEFVRLPRERARQRTSSHFVNSADIGILCVFFLVFFQILDPLTFLFQSIYLFQCARHQLLHTASGIILIFCYKFRQLFH